MATIVTDILCDLTQPVKVQYLHGNLFSQDNAANTINVHVHSAGVPESLGGTISANVIRSDGGTVAVAGSVSGDTATVVLPQACYAVPGVIHIIIKSTASSVVTTIAAVVANVYTSSTDTVVDPGTIITDVAALIDAIEDAVDSIPVDYSGLLATIAADYSSSKTYKVGQYAWQGGVLKRCIVPITTAETYTAAHWTNAVIGDDLSALKSAIDVSNVEVFGGVGEGFPLDFENGTYQATSTGSTLTKYYGGGYDLTRKVIKSTTFTPPCRVDIKAKTGYSFTVFLATNGKITSNTGLITEYTMLPGQQYGMTLRTTGGSDNISGVPVSSIIDVEYDSVVDKTVGLTKNLSDIVIYEYEFSNDIIHKNISPSTGKWIDATSYDFHYFEKPTNAKLLHIKSNATNGTVYAFLNASDTHTTGDDPSYATGSTRTFIPANTDAYIIIPDDCKYIWMAKTLSSGSYEPQYIGFNYDFSPVPTELEELTEWKNKNEMYFPINVFDGALTSGTINVSTGEAGASSAGRKTDFIDISAYQKIKYTRVITTASTAAWGMTFYDDQKAHISDTGEGPVLNGASYGYTLSEIEVPTGAKYARFTWNNTLPEVFAVYNAEQFNSSLVGEIEKLESYHPNYSGKRLSVLGDSISTFAATSEKTDGKAAEGCTTNYPGNPVQYSNSDVTSVDSTWWGRVLNQFGMVLGINESWAGSTIGYNPNQTSGGKYTADNCLCSATRIGHLGENGTPDIIIVFGGTNDINHHRVSSGSTIRYAVGSLDSEHNPYDFDNFPMITDTYYGSITTMLLRIQHTYPNATILMLLPYFCTYTHTSSGDRATPYDQNEWSKAAIDVCKYLGVEYLDLRTIINLYDVSSLLFDGLHPKANGMAAIAKAVIHKLNSML